MDRAPPAAARRRRRASERRQPGGGASPPGAASSRRSPSSGRSCSSSRICTGPTTACSTSSTSSSSWASGVPLLVVGTARPELLAAPARLGRRQAERARRSRSSPLVRRGDRAALVAGAARAAPRLDEQTQARRCSTRAGGNPLYAEQYAPRPRAERRTTCSGCRRRCRGSSPPGSTRSPRRRSGCSRTPRSSARCSGSGALEAVDGVTRWQAEELLHALERKEFVQRAPQLLGRRRERVRLPPRCSSATSPTARSRAPARSPSTDAPPTGSSRSDDPTITPRCSRTTTCRRSS